MLTFGVGHLPSTSRRVSLRPVGKGQYLGGGTLLGRGAISKARGRRGGIGTSGAALHEQRRIIKENRKLDAVKQIKVNQKILRQMGQQWVAEKRRKLGERLFLAHRVKTSSLAAALFVAIDVKVEPDT